jgi:predicted Zn-dependent peptidase
MVQNPLLNQLRKRVAVLAFSVILLVMRPLALSAYPASEYTLPNGLRVITAPNHAVGLVAIDAWVRAGVSRQSASDNGVAHYLEHVLFTGTTTRPREEAIDGAVEDLGGSLNAATSYDWAHFYLEVPAANFAPALAILGDVLQNATIEDKNVQAERPIILNEVARDLDNPDELMLAQIHKLAYGSVNPYGFMVTGTPADIQAVSHDRILDFYKAYYVPNNISLVVAGDVTPDQVQQEAIKEFGKWTASSDLQPPATQPAVTQTSIQRTVLRRGAGSSFMTVSFFAPSVKDQPDTWVMDVLLTLLGQGGNNRLDESLHKSLHLVDSVSDDYLTQRSQGLLTITCSFPSGNPDGVEAAILDQVKSLRDHPISDKELQGAKDSLFASYLFDVQTDSGRADALGFYDMIDTYQYDVDYVDHCQAVTAADVQRIAQKYLTPDAYNIVEVIPFSNPESAAAPAGSARPQVRSASF